MVGVKRPRPFPFDGAPYASFPCKIPWLTSSFHGADEYPSAIGDDMFKCKAGATNLREGPPPCSGTVQADWRNPLDPRREMNSEESMVPTDGGFLTLGSSLAAPRLPVAPRSKFRQSMVARATLLRESSEPESVPCHGGGHETILRFEGSSQSSEQLPFYSFLPMRPTSQEPAFKQQRHQPVDDLDLNLKL